MYRNPYTVAIQPRLSRQTFVWARGRPPMKCVIHIKLFAFLPKTRCQTFDWLGGVTCVLGCDNFQIRRTTVSHPCLSTVIYFAPTVIVFVTLNPSASTVSFIQLNVAKHGFDASMPIFTSRSPFFIPCRYPCDSILHQHLDTSCAYPSLTNP